LSPRPWQAGAVSAKELDAGSPKAVAAAAAAPTVGKVAISVDPGDAAGVVVAKVLQSSEKRGGCEPSVAWLECVGFPMCFKGYSAI
jgi:hypothetical protein